jgi:hypothetical protein
MTLMFVGYLIRGYIRRLPDEYMSFIFLLLPVLAASPNEEPPKQAKLHRNYTAPISHTHNQIHNIVYDKQKQNKFDNFKTI